MKQKFGYLLPTRERVMKGQLETAPLLALAEKAEDQGYDSIWVGDSLVARPRHDPLTTLAAISSRTQTVELGTAVLLPALRNPVALAQAGRNSGPTERRQTYPGCRHCLGFTERPR